jgi:23S rRNA (cytosine1962-C5)-methyltransferase
MEDCENTLKALPKVSSHTVTVRVERGAAKHLRRGHPWLFDGGIASISRSGAAGDLVAVFDPKRAFIGMGLFDPSSPIRVRMLTRTGGVTVNAAFFAERINTAVAHRAGLAAKGTDGYRLIYGAADGFPGLVVDRYGPALVLKIYSSMWFAHLRDVVEALIGELDPAHLVVRLGRNCGAEASQFGLRDGQLIHGELLPDPLLFRENGLTFEVDPLRGQKTGFYLDQRGNRHQAEALARGRDCLNVFSYSGAFSLYCARGGARSVISLDASQPALAAAQRNFVHNADHPDIAACDHQLLCADAFAALAELSEQKRRFAMVIIDPPSFANRKDQVERAKNTYRRLTRLGLGVLGPGGVLVFASCSSRIDVDTLRALIREAAQVARRPLRITDATGHGIDHPISFAEGAYLNCIFASA